MQLAITSLALFGMASGAAMALTPLPNCGQIESGMQTREMLAPAGSGLVIEGYENAHDQSTSRAHEAPVVALEGFRGLRVVHCATGRFMAVPDVTGVTEGHAALAGKGGLADSLAANKAVSASEMRRAVRAAFGTKALDLRETEETCGCAVHFPDLRPEGMTAFGARTDIGY